MYIQQLPLPARMHPAKQLQYSSLTAAIQFWENFVLKIKPIPTTTLTLICIFIMRDIYTDTRLLWHRETL